MPEYADLGALVTDKLSQWTKGFSDHFVAVDHVLDRTAEGQLTKKMFQQGYNPIFHQGVESAAKTANDAIKSGQHPGAVDIGKIVSEHRQIAREKIGGPKDVNFVTLAKSIQNRHGQLAAESYSNAVALMLKDYENPMAHLDVSDEANAKYLKRAGGLAPYAKFKANAVKGGVQLSNTKPSYTPVGKTEGTISSILHSTFAPMIVIPHVGTVFNSMFGTTPNKFLRSVAQPLNMSLSENIDKHEAMMITGALAETHLNSLREWNTFKATGIPKWRANSGAYFLYKALHQPGFRPLRDYTLLTGIDASQLSVKDLASKFAKNPNDKRLLWHLSQLGINPKDVLNQGGQLNQRQLEQAAYQFVDKHLFIDNTMSRSSFFQGTPAGRILGMYHGYVTRQSKLMAGALLDGFKGQGAVHTARNLAIMGTLFPVVGEIIKLSQMSVRGQDSVGEAQKDLENITGQGENGIYDGAASYFEALGHMGSFGIYNHLLRGGYTHSIIGEFAGPTFNSAANLTQDATKAGKKVISGDVDSDNLQDTLAPTERDLMYDTPGISTLAYVLGHRVLPKKTENPENAPERQLYQWFQDSKEQNTETEKEK